ncbi:hypothetical protein SAMN05443574_104266 [Haloarcula vallismortis]|uniref:Uncharacterized protein n=1 Tax=Haloarcula vallismortis TaxID=28442 RepID=A0A1H2ULU2_HALVA|nr:hypothetical protein SAMN05443574_104266 [Haloarcula vallismortis]
MYFSFCECSETLKVIDTPDNDPTVRFDPSVSLEGIGLCIHAEAKTMRQAVSHQQCTTSECSVETIVGARKMRSCCQNCPAY